MRPVGQNRYISRGIHICQKCSCNIALQNMYLLVTDHSYVSQTKYYHMYRARMVTRNWLLPHVWSIDA